MPSRRASAPLSECSSVEMDERPWVEGVFWTEGKIADRVLACIGVIGMQSTKRATKAAYLACSRANPL